MCDIWQQKKGHEITPEELKRAISNKAFSKIKSVGLNGGEPTLRNDIGQIASTLAKGLPSLRSLSIITNAIIAKRSIIAIDQIAAICHDYGLEFDVMVSLDGVGEVHDRVRGREGNFASSVKVINHILGHDKITTRRIGCTLISENALHAEETLNWCIEKGIYGRFRLGIPHQRLYSNDGRSVFNLTVDQKFHLANFIDYLRVEYETDNARKHFYKSLRDQLIYGLPRKAGCAWKSKGMTLLSNGDIAYCAVESPTIGNAITEDANSLYWNNSDKLNAIVKNKCTGCHHDYTGISSRKIILETHLKLLSNKLPTSLKSQLSNATKIAYQRRYKKLVSRLVQSSSIRKPKPLGDKILLCGWYGTETLGDKAIIGGIIESLSSQHSKHLIDIASLEPYVSTHTKRQMSSTIQGDVLSIDEANRHILNGEYKTVAIAGGPLMSCITRSVELLKLFSTAKSVGAKTVVAGCGVGPVTNDFKDQPIAGILKLADSILLRDMPSRDLARSHFKIDTDISVAVDPAFVWIAKNTGADTRPTSSRILMALRDWPYNEYAKELGEERSRATKLKFERELLDFVDALPDQLVPIPFCMHKYTVGGDDRYYHHNLWKDRPAVRRRIDWQHQTPIDDLEQIGSSSGVLAMRFHSVVFALATNRPFLAIDYTRGGKISGLLRMLNLENRLVAIEDFNGATAAQLLQRQIEEPPTDILRRVIDESIKAQQSIVELFR